MELPFCLCFIPKANDRLGATTLAIGTGAIISSRTSFDKGEFITSDTSSESSKFKNYKQLYFAYF